ncbi:hypothetical protein F5880DRAFT_1512277, partial [Lentinula raphanica]
KVLQPTPYNDGYPKGDDDDNNNSNGEPTLSGDELLKIQNACERCQQLEWVEACHLCASKGKTSVDLGSGRVAQMPGRPGTRGTPEPVVSGAGYPTQPGAGFILAGSQLGLSRVMPNKASGRQGNTFLYKKLVLPWQCTVSK